MSNGKTKKALILISIIVVLTVIAGGVYLFHRNVALSPGETRIERNVSSMLRASSRRAELVITGVSYDGKLKKLNTTARFTEYNAKGKPLEPLYLHFNGNVIQIQSLTVRLSGLGADNPRRFQGKSAYLFWKAFLPDGSATKTVELTPMNSIPRGYKVRGAEDPEEDDLWKKIWSAAVNPSKSDNVNISNVSIKAGDKIFTPGTSYTLHIVSGGRIKYDTTFLPRKK